MANQFSTALGNLDVFGRCCAEHDVTWRLFGRTLLFLNSTGLFPGDLFDNVCLIGSANTLSDGFLSAINSAGFHVKARDDWNILLERNGRLLELSCFTSEANVLVNRGIRLPKENLCHGGSLNIEGRDLNIPADTEELIDSLWRSANAAYVFRTTPHLGRKGCYARSTVPREFLRHVLAKLPASIQNSCFRLAGSANRRVVLDQEGFKALYFEEDPLNWRLRKPHLDILTANGKLRTVGEIIDYLSDAENLARVMSGIEEGPAQNEYYREPLYFNTKFWHSGNNLFINCVLYSFRKNVISYERLNSTSFQPGSKRIYSADYYESLEPMSETEISRLLERMPILVAGHKLVGGRHRVCAMIGRLVNGQSYLPVHALRLPA
jgi:hypothetical protein